MATNDMNISEDAEMNECEGDEVLTMMDVLQEQQNFEEDADAVLGASDDKNCTFSKGYVKRQAVYACLTCCSDAKFDPTKRAGICLACSLNCHENHQLVELYTRRNFRCDCGNPKFNSHPCNFTPDKTDLNEDNVYNQNFTGLYCTCHRPYPDPELEDEMIQCIICEDWLHAQHLEATAPAPDQYAEMICKECMQKNEFLHDYSEFSVNIEEDNVDVVNNSINDVSLNGSLIENESNISEKSSVTNNKDNIELKEDHSDHKHIRDDNNDKSLKNTEIENGTMKELTETISDKETEELNNTCDLPATKTEYPENSEGNKEKAVEKDTVSKSDQSESELGNDVLNDIDKFLAGDDEVIRLKDNNDVMKQEHSSDSQNLEEDKTETVNMEAKGLDINDDSVAIKEVENKEKLEETAAVEENEDHTATNKDLSNFKENQSSDDVEQTSMRTKEFKATINLQQKTGDLVNIDNIMKENTVAKGTENIVDEDSENKVATQFANNETGERDNKVSKDLKDILAQDSKSNEAASTKNEISYIQEKEISESINTGNEDIQIDQLPETLEINEQTIEEEQVGDTENKEQINGTDIEKQINGNENKEQINDTENEEKINGTENEALITNGHLEPVKDNKRKLSTENCNEKEITMKKPKLDSCTRPKSTKKAFRGATFWPSNFRQKLCSCSECMTMYKDLSVLFLVDLEDTFTAYQALGKQNTSTNQYERGLEALSSLDRTQQINAMTEYNKMRDELLSFLESFRRRKKIVKAEDIKAFFAGMKPKREPDGVYFCR